MRTASTSGGAGASPRSCRPPGSATSMPSRVVKTGRTSPIDGKRHAQVEHEPADAQDEGDGEEHALRPQDGREDLLVADLAEPEPVGVEATSSGRSRARRPAGRRSATAATRGMGDSCA